MDVMGIIKELQDERDLVEQAILSIERMAAQRGKRRGRTPEWLKAIENEAAAPKKRGRPSLKNRQAK
jgi:hypothetical protein